MDEEVKGMLTMRQKKAVTKELKDRYQRASKKEKTMIGVNPSD